MEDLEKKRERISAWWKGELIDRACCSFAIPKPDKKKAMEERGSLLNGYWSSEDEEPDLENLVERQIELINANIYFGEAMPTFPHDYGRRGTPMILAAYLGGRVELKENTVWVKPVVEDWRKFEIHFDPENIWYRRSYDFFKLAVEKCSTHNIIPWLPDFGDALTVLSLLRGSERLLFDLIDNREAVLEARNKFIQVWPEFHKRFYQLYSHKFPGDNSWLIWAPGKTYACQCDFSTMISPEMFKEFVVPEIEAIGKYLDYIVWHLDGPDEIRHLDILLDLPQIKVIQWVPGAGNPPAVKWLPMLKRIQEKGRNLMVYAGDEEEVKTLLEELSPKGLFISGGFTGKTEKEAEEFIKMISR